MNNRCLSEKALFQSLNAHSSTLKYGWHWLVFVLLVSFNFWQLNHHILWRDELQAWLIASESSDSLSDLFRNMRHEPQPGLWYLLLWLLSQFSKDPFIMQLFHFLCGTAAALLVMVFAPFSALTRLLVVAGYYLSFEYLIISRNYVLGVLMVFLFCSTYETIRRKPLVGGVILGVLANTSTYGTIISLALLGGLVADIFSDRHKSDNVRIESNNYFSVLGACYLPFLLGSFSMIAFSRSNYAADWLLEIDLNKMIFVVLSQIIFLLPVPDFTVNFWNTNVFADHNIVILIVSVIIVSVLIATVLLRTKIGFWTFIGAFGVIVLLQYTKLTGCARYYGQLFIYFLACVWLGSGPWKTIEVPSFFTKTSRLCFSVILAFHLFATVVADFFHATNPFSSGSAMAAFIRENGYQNRPIVGDFDYAVTTVAGYLGQKIYHITTGKPGSFVRWNDERRDNLTRTEAHDVIVRIMADTGKRPLVLLNYPSENEDFRLLGKAEGAIVNDENYYLYEYSR